MSKRPEQAAARLGNGSAVSAYPLGGAAHAVRMADGRTLVVKGHSEASAVQAEAASLRWLAGAGSVAVPAVWGYDEEWLVTDHVESGSSSRRAAEGFGRDLARMHRAGADAFGSPPAGGPTEGSIGLAPMRNESCADWPGFYGRFRVEPYLETAVNLGIYSGSDAGVFHRVLDHLEEIAGPVEPPSRLHGDLWSGNVVWGADGQAWLIDPAGHGGHRETDLAMLQLFGCPHLDVVLRAYDSESPLAAGWRDRVPLHQLFPLLVHVVLFGGGYAAQALRAARSALGLL